MSSPRIKQLLQLLESGADPSFVLFALAKTHESNQQPDEALAYYTRLQTENPDYVGLYYHLGKLHERSQRPDAALAAYNAGLKVAQRLNDRHAYNELAEARLGLADDED